MGGINLIFTKLIVSTAHSLVEISQNVTSQFTTTCDL
jgi:hypothetical protein